jgi:hypothetical protein
VNTLKLIDGYNPKTNIAETSQFVMERVKVS